MIHDLAGAALIVLTPVWLFAMLVNIVGGRSVRRDARRYCFLRDTVQGAVSGGVEVNDAQLYYEKPKPGKAVRLYWYPDTPIGFYEAHGATLDEAIDKAMRGEE